MTILDQIVQKKRKEIEDLLLKVHIEDIEKKVIGLPPCPPFYEALNREGPSIIAEFKRRSPSKGLLNKSAEVAETVSAYKVAGAAAVSVLTDSHFDGRAEDLQTASSVPGIPLLRKDFIVHRLQIAEARLLGASAVLLIAGVLEKKEIHEFTRYALSLGLDVLLEIHSEEELDKIGEENRIVGINNRNLNTFVVDMEHSIRMASKLGDEVLRVSESGINDPGMVKSLFDAGFNAFLLGERFMKTPDPGKSAGKFISSLNNLL